MAGRELEQLQMVALSWQWNQQLQLCPGTAEHQQRSCFLFSALPMCNTGTNDTRTKMALRILMKVGHSIFRIDLLTATYLQLLEANYFTRLN